MEGIGTDEATGVLRVLAIDASERDVGRLLDALRGGGYLIYSRQVALPDDLSQVLAEERWDIVLAAAGVPGLPVADIVDRLQAADQRLPVVLALERGMQASAVELLDEGVSDFVFKSNPSRLLAVVERECAQARLIRDDALFGSLAALAQADRGEFRFLQLASNTPECYWLTDAATREFSFVSPGYEQIWGRYVEALYANPDDWLQHVHDDDRERVADEMRCHRQGGLDVIFRVQRAGEGLRWLHARNFPVYDEEGKVVSVGGVASDVTLRIEEQRKAPFFAHFDALTALPNQLMFYDQARRLIALARRKAIPLGVMVIDIDRFNEVNRSMGHLSGDELLRQVAGRMSGSLRESDILGRLGNDVFAALMPELADAHQAQIVARRMIDTLTLPIGINGQDVFATAGIGIAFFPQDGHDAHELVSHARIAVSHAKSQGRNSFACFSAEMNETIRGRLFAEAELRNAVLRHEFVLYYQPKVSCANGKINGAEALLRWQHPRRGLVPPDQFIPLLEETGLIIPVGRWVIGEACRQLAQWQAAGIELPSVSVNLSARQLQSDTLLDDIAAALAASGIPAGCLDLELTESMLMHNSEANIRLLSRIKALGVTLSLDDFGTGYSSLAYLKRFPLDAVKVDRAFVQDIVADGDDASITRAVITMAHHLKLKVIAEGVETREQLSLLISHQCDIIQGYFFSRPLAVEAMQAVLEEARRLPDEFLDPAARKPMVLFVHASGCEEIISQLVRGGQRVCTADDTAAAMRWVDGNLVDVLVCGGPREGFDALGLLGRVAEKQPQCERILLADSRQWSARHVAQASASGLAQRVIHLPADTISFLRGIEEALGRRQASDDYLRLSHEMEATGRELMRLEIERRRLAEQNQVLLAMEGQGYHLLQELVAELPWPVLGIDEQGMLALFNEAAQAGVGQIPLAPGIFLRDVLPDLEGAEDNGRVTLGARLYCVHRRLFRPQGSLGGSLLLLEEIRE